MLGAIAGDIIGSFFEHSRLKIITVSMPLMIIMNLLMVQIPTETFRRPIQPMYLPPRFPIPYELKKHLTAIHSIATNRHIPPP